MNPVQVLPRVLGPWMAGAVVVGCVIGSGVFKKAHSVAENVPYSGVALGAWVLVGVLTLFGALALAEVAVLFPRSGGNYVFLREAFGRPWAFLWGWVEFWFLRAASNAAVASVFAESFHDLLKLVRDTDAELLGFWPRQFVAVGVILLLGHVNARGTVLGGRLQVFITTVKVGSLLALMLLPFLVLAFVADPRATPSTATFAPLMPRDWSTFNFQAFGAAMIAVMWAYNGWTNIAPIAGEVVNPSRNVPRALIGGVFVLIAVYVGVNLSYYTILSGPEMAAHENSPVATLFCGRLLGNVGVLFISAAILTSTFGSLAGTILVGPRGLFAMAGDGLAPRWLTGIHPRFQTPFPATIAVTLCSALIVLGGAAYARLANDKPAFDLITNFSIFGATVFETLAVATIFVFRAKRPDAERPYRCWGYPVVPALYILAMSAVMLNMLTNPEQRGEAFVGIGFMLVGAVVYAVCFGRRRA